MTEHITVSRELLRQVLEATERSKETAMHQTLIARIPESGLFGGIAQDLDWAATELRAALAEPAPEPYAWMAVGGTIWRHKSSEDDVPLYTSPQPQQPAVEPAQTLIAKLQADPDYAWSWHCNIAMAYVDAGGDPYTGNQGAARFMKLFANVDPAHELPAPQPQQPAVAWRLKDAEATEHYGKSIYVYYDSADLRTDHPDTKKVTTMMEPLFTSPPQPAEVPLLTVDEIKDALRHLYQNDTVLGMAIEISIDEFREIEQAVRQKAGLK